MFRLLPVLLLQSLSYPLKEHADPKYLVKIIDRVIGDYLAWRSTHAPRRIEIDLSKLANIRSTAAETREALLVDEERAEAVASPAPEPTASTPKQKAEGDSPLGLTKDELAFVQALLDGNAPSVDATDLLVDSINEKFFDLLGDTALEFDEAGAPMLVEDYVEDVREAIG